MSLKENVELVKEELNSEEQFFQKAVMTERFVKKYKKSIIAVVSVIFIAVIANFAYTLKEQNRISKANEQLAILLNNPNNVKAKEELASLSPKLYAAWSFSEAILHQDTKKLSELQKKNFPIISDVAAYEVAVSDQNVQALNNYALKQEALYKDLANIESATILIQTGKTKEAKTKLALIPQNSPLYEIASILNHYGVK